MSAPKSDSSVQYSHLSLGDVIGVGLGKLAQHILPVILLALIPAIASAILKVENTPNIAALKTSVGFHYMTLFRFYEQHGISAIFSLIVTIICYAYFPLVLYAYVKDIYEEQPLQEIWFYLIPRQFYLGLLGVNAVYVLGIVVAMTAITLGTVFLVIPGLIALALTIYIAARYILAPAVYVMEFEKCISQAFRTSWELTQNNIWRTLGIIFALALMAVLVQAPFSFLITVFHMVIKFTMAYSELPLWAHITFVGLVVLSNTASLVIGTGGGTFIMLRYYYDLKSRQMGIDESLHGWRARAEK